MKKILLLAAFVYFFLAPITYHPDNKLVLMWAGSEQGAVWNIWSYGQDNFENGKQFNYPPLHFYLAKIQYFLAKGIAGGEIDSWLASPNYQDGHETRLVVYNLAIKSGLIGFALLVGYLLYVVSLQAGYSKKRARIVACLWLFNPIVLYSVPILGQNDVMPIAFFLAGWLALKSRQNIAILLFGAAASIKMYPLIWLLYLLISQKQYNLFAKSKIFFASLAVYVLTLLPFISNKTFREAVLQSDINMRFLIPQIDIGFAEAVYVIPLLLMILLLIAGFKSEKKTNIEFPAFVLMTMNVILLGFAHFHPQWYTWVIPFWAVWLVSLSKKALQYALLVSMLSFISWVSIVFLFKDSFLTFGLLTPLNPALISLPSIQFILETAGFDFGRLNNLAHTWLAGAGLLSMFYLVVEESKNKGSTLQIGFEKLPALRLKNKYMIVLVIVVVSLTFLFSITFLSQMIPARKSSLPPLVTAHIPILKTVSTEFIAEHDNLARVDVYFRDENLNNFDAFNLTVSHEEFIVLEQEFNGLNAGYDAYIRFDFEPQLESKGKKYTLTIEPLSESSKTILLIGATEESGTQTPALISFYEPQKHISVAIDSTLLTLSSLFQQLWFFYLMLFALLVLIVW